MHTRAVPSRPSRSGRVPVWVVCALLAVAIDLGVRETRGRVIASGFTSIDARCIDLRGITTWVVPGWEELLAARLARLGPVSTLDADGLAALGEEVARLPFVASVGTPRVIWPDGLELDIELREPVACLRSGGLFYPVAVDGVVLPGAFSRPPDSPRGFLPVIGQGELEGARPGDQLAAPHLLDALSVAESLLQHLAPESNRRLGPIVVDATRAAEADAAEPGTRLLLEERRLVLFGRPPSARAPGELPAALKWSHLARGAASLAAGQDWDLLDVRWDRAEVRRRRSDD